MAEIILLDSFEGWNTTDPLVKWDTIANYDSLTVGAQYGRNSSGALVRSGGTSVFDPLATTVGAGNSSVMLEKYFIVPAESVDVGLALKLNDVELVDYLPIISFISLSKNDLEGFLGQYYHANLSLLLTPQQQLVYCAGNYWNNPTPIIGSYSPPIKRGVFSYIEAHIRMGTTGLLRLRIDGKVVIDEQIDNTTGSPDYYVIGGVRLFHHKSRIGAGANARTFLIDDVYIATNGPTQFRDGLIEAAFPEGTGGERDWNPSNAGTFNYDMVDDAQPDEDSTYNRSVDQGEIDTYRFSAPNTSGSIHGVAINVDVANKAFDHATLSSVFRTNDTNYISPTQRIGTIMPGNPKGYRYNIYGYVNNPATNVQFNREELSTGEFGMMLVTVEDGEVIEPPPEENVPNAPSSLNVTANSSTQITATFFDNSDNELGFVIQKSDDGLIYDSGITTNSSPYIFNDLQPNTTYYFKMYAFNSVGNSVYSNITSVTTPASPTAPTAPSNLTLTVISPVQINASWTDNSSSEFGFKVEKSTSEFSGFSVFTTTLSGVVTCQITGLTASTTYYIRIGAYNGVGTNYSSTISATTSVAPSAPQAPSDLVATAISPTQIDLTWADNSTTETGFKLQRSLSPSSGFVQIATPGANSTSYSNSSGLSPNVTYYFRILATNTTGDSSYSNTASATTAQTPVGIADYYVSLLGSDGNPGTISQPFRTISKGMSVLTAGKKLYIRDGVYNERISTTAFSLSSGTSYSNAITIAAYPGETVTIRPSGSGQHVLYMLYQGTSYSYIIFDRITFDANNKANTFAVSLDGYNFQTNIHHIRFTNCIFTGSNLSGVLTGRGANFLEFINCKAHTCGSDDQYDHGMYLQSSDCLVSGGEYYNNISAGIQIYTGLDSGGGSLSDRANRNVVKKARIYNNRFGLILGSGDTNAAYSNFVYSNTLEGIKTGFTGGANTKIYNNTVYANGNNGIEVRSGITGVRVINNITYLNGTNLLDLGSSTFKANNPTTNPSFVNAATGDFHLQSGSSALNAGSTLSEVPDDIDGDLRPQGSAFDIGADERLP